MDRTNMLFLAVACAVMVTALLDVYEAQCADQATKYALNYAYFIIRNATPPVYILYICSFIGIWHRLGHFKPLMLLVTVPYLVDIVLLVTNPITGAVFVIDENAVYTRGPLMPVLYVVAFYYMLLSVIILIKNKKLVDIKKNLILLLFQPLSIFAVLTQMLFPLFRIEIFGTAILAVVMAVGVHNPDEYLESVVGLKSAAGFLVDIKNIIDY
jgi:hypothetical protein